MTGFSVAELAPFRGGRGALRLGLAALKDADWLDRGPGLAARIAAKRPILDSVPESLISLAEAAPAVAELAALVAADGDDLRAAALAIHEDIAILLPSAGAHILVAGAVAFPTDWDLPAKIGHPLLAIHAPIPTYAERLGVAVDYVFANLAPGRLLTRANWNIVETDALRYLPHKRAIDRFGHVTAANAGAMLFVRVERQALRRLPASGAAVFTIGVYLEPLAALPTLLVRDLAAAVAGLPAEESHRRGAPAFRDALAAYAAGRAS